VTRRDADPSRPTGVALRSRGFWLASAGILFAVLALGIVEGVLPLHLGRQLSQAEIGALYLAASLVASASAVAGARLAPRPLLLASIAPVVAGVGAIGASRDVPLWVLALLVTATGIGLANTGSLGVLVSSIKPDRIVTAMVVWSQIGIAGYAVGPLVGGAVTDAFGYAVLGLLPAIAGFGLLVIARTDSTTGPN
jgi:MFS family permease